MNLLGEIVPNIRREEECVLSYARAVMSGPARARIDRLITTPLNWRRIEELASTHRVCPLLYKHLKHDSTRPPIPVVVWKAIEGHAFSVTARNAAQAEELTRVIKLFRTEDIAALPFKGPALAAHAYENLSLREFSDLDLLVQSEDLLRAKLLLIHHGFLSAEEGKGKKLELEVGSKLISADRETRVALHSSLGEGTDLEGVFKRAVWIDIRKSPIRTVARDDLLPYLCANGAAEHWSELFRVVDVAETIRVEKEIDLAALLATARANGNWRVVALGLYLAFGLLDAPVPRNVVDEIGVSEIRELAQDVGSWLFNAENRPERGGADETRFLLKAKERVSDRLAFSTQFLKRKLLPKRKK